MGDGDSLLARTDSANNTFRHSCQHEIGERTCGSPRITWGWTQQRVTFTCRRGFRPSILTLKRQQVRGTWHRLSGRTSCLVTVLRLVVVHIVTQFGTSRSGCSTSGLDGYQTAVAALLDSQHPMGSRACNLDAFGYLLHCQPNSWMEEHREVIKRPIQRGSAERPNRQRPIGKSPCSVAKTYLERTARTSRGRAICKTKNRASCRSPRAIQSYASAA